MSKTTNLRWPFIPISLSDILDEDTLAVIESGCCERYGRTLTILDFDPKTGGFTHRIESINQNQHYEEFCRCFRDGNHVKNGDILCRNWDVEQTKISLKVFQETGNPFRLFPCHMGLMDMTYIIQIRGRPVALIFSGQFSPAEVGIVNDALQKFEDGGDEAGMAHLHTLSQNLLPLPIDARARLELEALHIQRIADAEFERRKWQSEQEFLDSLRNATNVFKSMDWEQLRNKIFVAIHLIKEFCRCEYVLFFAGTQENNTVLMPLAQVGPPKGIEGQLPHFNWSKARLPLENFALDQRIFSSDSQNMMSNGIRGDNREYLTNAACLIPIAVGDRYRSVLALGPFVESINIEAEQRFLIEIARIIGLFARTGFEMLYLEQERRRWKNTATLLNHEVKTALTTIMTPIGRARNIVNKNGNTEAKRADEYLKQAEDRSLLLSRITSGTLEGIAIKVEFDDLEFENYSLSALVENCANGFLEAARSNGLELVLDNSISTLPYATVDIPRLTIAIANLIENAIKYSFSGSRILIRSHLDITLGMEHAIAIIEVDNIGFEIREEDRQRIFDIGERGGNSGGTKSIPGSGYGLWEARSIVEAHGGEIHVKFHPTAIHKREGRASRVVFSVRIPLKQKKGSGGGYVR